MTTWGNAHRPQALRGDAGHASWHASCRTTRARAYPGVKLDTVEWGEAAGEAGRAYLPHACMHCENPECVSVCPTGASQKLDDGVVIVDYDACITCGYCMSACPYGARSADEGSSYAVEMQAADQVTAPEYGVDHGARGKYRGTYGTVRKCTFCAHRIAEGRGARVLRDVHRRRALLRRSERSVVEGGAAGRFAAGVPPARGAGHEPVRLLSEMSEVSIYGI